MTPITLLSEMPMSLSRPWFKGQAVKYLDKVLGFIRGDQIGGSKVVQYNLTSGLTQLGQSFKLNPPAYLVTPLVGVLSNTDALRWAIIAKRQGKIRYLVAGPNLVVTPQEQNGIICASEIDLVVTPSRWVSDHYLSMAPMLAGKLVEWPVGVDTEFWAPDPTISRQDRAGGWLVYDKTQSGGSVERNMVVEALSQKGEHVTWIVYGKYKPEEYRKKLQSAKAMIVLSPSESQGIAMFEAWACDTPTLVWDRKMMEYKGMIFKSPSVSSSPYLSNESGRSFQNAENFLHSLIEFEKCLDNYIPRDYILRNYTLRKAAENYIGLFKKGNIFNE